MTTADWIVQFNDEALVGLNSIDDAPALLPAHGQVEFNIVRGLGAVGLVSVTSSGLPADVVARRLAANPRVGWFQLDTTVKIADTEIPDDPLFSQQWPLANTGQTGGSVGADVSALTAWHHTRGNREIVVAEIDSGIDYTHPDLAANIWVNPLENDSGQDADGNGFAGDLHGWDFVNSDSAPLDDNGHGTHVAGIIGAVGNNGAGVVGVNWEVSLMALKAFDRYGSAKGSNLVAAINYVNMMHDRGVNVVAINASWDSGGFDAALSNAIAAAGERGILFVAAAGNYDSNNDNTPFYPAGYNLDNIISVAATDSRDQLASFSNYGLNTVDLAAPGASILSTVPGGGYGIKSGTSMAAPFVTGAVAQLQSLAKLVSLGRPYTDQEIKAAILETVDPLSGLTSKVHSGGRLNLHRAAETLLNPPTIIPESYVASSVPLFPVTLVAGTPGVMTLIDDSLETVAVPLDLGSNVFRFFGVDYTGDSSLYVASNGLVTFGRPSTTTTHVELSTLDLPTIVTHWDGLTTDVDATDNVLAKLVDLGGNGTLELVIQWEGYHLTEPYTRSRFQAILALNTGIMDGGIALMYPDVAEGELAHDHSLNTGVGITAGTQSSQDTLDLTYVTYPRIGENEGVAITRSRPTGELEEILPDPHAEPVDSVRVVFSQPILPGSFDPRDVRLERNGLRVSVEGDVSITYVSPAVYRIDGLARATSFSGDYTLAVDVSGVNNVSGQRGFGIAETSWTTRFETPNVRMLSATADGRNSVTVTYEIESYKLSTLDLGIYASPTADFVPDTSTPIDLVTINTLEDLTVGVHTVTFTVGSNFGQVRLPGAGVADLTGNYHLLFVADPRDTIPEAEAFPGVDNTVGFSGVYHVTKGLVMVQGTAAADVVGGATASTQVTVTLNGTTYTYVATDVTGVNVRLQGGDDSFVASTLAKVVTAWGGDGNDTLKGGTLADVLGGCAGNDTITGNGGNDSLSGNAGNDSLVGGAGNDSYLFDADWQLGSDTLVENASAGADLIDFTATLNHSAALDLSATTAQVVNANLTVTLSSGTNFENVSGGGLADLLLGNTAANVLTGNAGNDTLNGGDGNDVLEGGAGDDSLTGGNGNDSYKFGTNVGLGSDTLVETSTSGTDTLDFSPSTTLGVTVNLSTATAQVVNANLTVDLGSGSVFENVTGGSQSDTLTGNTLANTLIGNAGNDFLDGGDGNDALTGGAGNDSLVGGNGNDSYNFSTNTALGSDTVTDTAGTDTLNFATSTTLGVTVDLSSTAAQVVNANLTLTLASGSAIENATGGSQADTLTGNTLANALVGNGGNDTLNGQSGTDTLTGGAGNDLLTGGPGDDWYPLTMNTALGADTIVEVAGGGTDTLDFSATTTLGITLNLASTAAQVLNANLTLTLSAADGLEWVIGTAKNDIVSGNALNNLLIGGAGNDQLSGFDGRDLIVGGTGADTLRGGDDDDILIAGTFTYFNETTKVLNVTGLQAILNEWSQLAVAYATRVANLRNGGGLNGTNKLDSSTVLTDGTAVDNLWGDGGLDWFWAFASDVVKDQTAAELQN